MSEASELYTYEIGKKNEQIAKLREQLAAWRDAADKAQMPAEFYKEYSEATMRAMQAMLTKERERAEAAEAKVGELEVVVYQESVEYAELMRDYAAAEAKLKAMDEQEPVAFKHPTSTVYSAIHGTWHGEIALYAKPVPPVDAQELQRIRRMADCGTAQSFLGLSDEDKRKWFAMSVEESARRKQAEADKDSLIESLEMQYRINEQSCKRIAELERKLAEQQAVVSFIAGHARDDKDYLQECGFQELNTLLVQAEKSRDEYWLDYCTKAVANQRSYDEACIAKAREEGRRVGLSRAETLARNYYNKGLGVSDVVYTLHNLANTGELK